MPARRSAAILLVTAAVLSAADLYRAVFVDDSGQLHIVLDSRKETLPAKLDGQVAFAKPLISTESQTVGWLAIYPYPPGTDLPPSPGALVLYRANHVIHTFSALQPFEDWQFRDGGRQVAYAVAPAHGELGLECVLRDVKSGQIVDKWVMSRGGEPPSWARDLRY